MRYLFPAAAILSALSLPALAVVSSVSVDDTALLQGNGARVLLTGEVVCTAGEMVIVNADVSQGVGRRDIAAGSGGTSFSCTGGSMEWSVPVNSYTGTPFKNGRAAVNVSSYSCTEFECMSGASTSGEIRLGRH